PYRVSASAGDQLEIREAVALGMQREQRSLLLTEQPPRMLEMPLDERAVRKLLRVRLLARCDIEQIDGLAERRERRAPPMPHVVDENPVLHALEPCRRVIGAREAWELRIGAQARF